MTSISFVFFLGAFIDGLNHHLTETGFTVSLDKHNYDSYEKDRPFQIKAIFAHVSDSISVINASKSNF